MRRSLIRLLRSKLNSLDNFEKDLQIVQLTQQALDLLLEAERKEQISRDINAAIWHENRKLYADIQTLAFTLKPYLDKLENNKAVEIAVKAMTQTYNQRYCEGGPAEESQSE